MEKSTSQVNKLEEQITEDEDDIEHLEKEIETKEKSITKAEGRIYNLEERGKFSLGGILRYQVPFFRGGFLRRFKKHKLVYGFTIVLSVVLIWRGIWSLVDITPGISNPLISILLGVFILWLVDNVSELI